MSSLQFDVFISAEKDTELWIIPPDFYKGLMEQVGRGGQLYQPDHGIPVYGCHVAHGPGDVEELR